MRILIASLAALFLGQTAAGAARFGPSSCYGGVREAIDNFTKLMGADGRMSFESLKAAVAADLGVAVGVLSEDDGAPATGTGAYAGEARGPVVPPTSGQIVNATAPAYPLLAMPSAASGYYPFLPMPSAAASAAPGRVGATPLPTPPSTPSDPSASGFATSGRRTPVSKEILKMFRTVGYRGCATCSDSNDLDRWVRYQSVNALLSFKPQLRANGYSELDVAAFGCYWRKAKNRIYTRDARARQKAKRPPTKSSS